MNSCLGILVLSTTLAGALAMLGGGCSKTPEVTGTPTPTTTVGTEIDDSVITATVKSALLADPDVKSFDFKVETRKGEVQLSGFVDGQTQVDRAISIARGVAGVKGIDNKVSMKSAATTVGNKIDDEIVTARVKGALLADANVKSFDIAVVTRKGEVQLSGFVDNQGQIDRALEVARAVQGAGSVTNEMSIKK